MKKRVILSAGGTGGHLFPAQSLAKSLPDYEILFAAGGLHSNRYFSRDEFAYKEVSCATFSLSRPVQIAQGSWKIWQGVRQSRQLLRQFSPDLVIGFGSFFTLPVLLAALLEKIPIILHEQNAIPGKVNKLFSHYAHHTAITFPSTRLYLKGKGKKRASEVLFPIRKGKPQDKEEIYRFFNLSASRTTLLIFGGSQGASRLNFLALEALKSSSVDRVQVLHFTGNDERTAQARAHYESLELPACVKSFEPRIDLAMQISDLALTRAGAATIAELIEFELPAILIPFPHATENHQEKNGTHFVSIVKGGSMYKENELTPAHLARVMGEQLKDVPHLKANIAEYKKHRTAKQLVELIEEFYAK